MTFFKYTALFLCIIFLTSCSNIEIIELNERLIIEAIGIDYEDDVYKVTIEGLDSFTSGSDINSISPGKLTKCHIFTGETIGMAMNSISRITGQIPLFSQARVLIIGMDTAKTRLSQVLDFFRREYTTRTDILIAVSEKSARETVSADFGENVSAGNIFEAALSSYRYTGKCTYTPLYRFLNSLMGETDSAFCPVIAIKSNDFSDKKEAELPGTAIFRKDGSVFTISDEETLALNLINNKIKNGDITVNNTKGICTFEIIDCKTKTRINTESGKAEVSIDIRLKCDIPEFQTENFSGLSKEDISEIEKDAEIKITQMCKNLTDKILKNEHCDTFNLGRKINLVNHSFYTGNIKNGAIPEDLITLNISTDVQVRRIGKVILEKDE